MVGGSDGAALTEGLKLGATDLLGRTEGVADGLLDGELDGVMVSSPRN